MATQATDYSDYGVDNPEDVAQEVYKEGEDNAAKQPNSNLRTADLIYNKFITRQDPRVVQAQALQSRMKDILNNVGPSPDGEDPLDLQLRQANAVARGVIDINPQVAMQAAAQATKLQQAKFQQAQLQASTQNTQAEATKRTLENKIEKVVLHTQPSIGEDGNISMPQITATLDPNDPNFSTQLNAAQADAQSRGLTVLPSLSSDFESSLKASSLMSAQMKLGMQDRKFAHDEQMANLRSQLAAQSGLTEDGLKTATLNQIMNPDMVTRMKPGDKVAMQNYMAAEGITGQDIQSARLEQRGLQAAATTAGRRDGNISVLANSMDGMGAQVLDTLKQVDRGNVQMLNQAFASGRTQFGNANETRYAAAINSFVNEYARVIAGGTNQTTDASRAEAMSLINRAQSPEQVKAVVDQLGNKETQIVKGASEEAIEQLANPKRYSHLSAISEKLGIGATNYGQGVTNTPGTTASTTVRVKLPDGRTGTIPTSRLAAYKAQGATEIPQ